MFYVGWNTLICSDRLIWIFMLLIVIGIVGIIIWTMVDPEGSSKYATVPDQVKPPTPDELADCYSKYKDPEKHCVN